MSEGGGAFLLSSLACFPFDSVAKQGSLTYNYGKGKRHRVRWSRKRLVAAFVPTCRKYSVCAMEESVGCEGVCLGRESR